MPGGGCGIRAGDGDLPWRCEAEVFDRKLKHVHQEPLMICPRPWRRGRFPPPYLARTDLDVPEPELSGRAGEGIGQRLL